MDDYAPRDRASIAAERRVLAMAARDTEISSKPFFLLNTALVNKGFAAFAMAGKPKS